MHAELEKSAKQRDICLKGTAACFKDGSTKAETTYGEVVDRNNDWGQIFPKVDGMTKTINSVSRTAVAKKMRECTEMLDVIMRKIERGDFANVSPQVAMNLSNGAFEVASELEFFAVTHYRVQAMAGAIDNTVQHVTKSLSKDTLVSKAASFGKAALATP